MAACTGGRAASLLPGVKGWLEGAGCSAMTSSTTSAVANASRAPAQICCFYRDTKHWIKVSSYEQEYVHC